MRAQERIAASLTDAPYIQQELGRAFICCSSHRGAAEVVVFWDMGYGKLIHTKSGQGREEMTKMDHVQL